MSWFSVDLNRLAKHHELYEVSHSQEHYAPYNLAVACSSLEESAINGHLEQRIHDVNIRNRIKLFRMSKSQIKTHEQHIMFLFYSISRVSRFSAAVSFID